MPIILFKQTHPTKKLNLRLGGDGTYRNDTCLPTGFDLTREAIEYGGHDDDDLDGYGYHYDYNYDSEYDYTDDYTDDDEFDFDRDGFSNEYCALCCSKTCSFYAVNESNFTGAGVVCV